MASEVSIKCWLCPQTFPKSIELKHHAIDKHEVCRVICPWCPEKKETFKRVSELCKHSKRRHPDLVEELKELDFFNEANGFWLATKPLEYAKIIKPTDWPNSTAIRTRAAFLGWLEKRGTKERSRESWEREWNHALGLKPLHETPKNKKRKLQYSPQRATSVNLQIDSITLTSSNKVAYLKLEESSSQLWYKVQLHSWMIEDRKAMDNLLRKMGTLGESDPGRPETFRTEITLKDASYTISQITRALGVGERHINQLWREIRKISKIDVKDLEEAQQELMDIGDDPQYEIMDSIEEEEDKSGRIVIVKETIAMNEDEDKEGSQVAESMGIKDNRESEEKEVQVVPTQDQEVDKKQEGLETSNKSLTIQEQEREEVDTRQEVLGTPQSLTMRERAAELLKAGGMPLFPPGRRQWGMVNQEIKISEIPTQMFWPPKDWQKMSPKERLTAWRFASYSLAREQGLAGCKKEYDLLDEYAMLALPGTFVEKQEGTPSIIT